MIAVNAAIKVEYIDHNEIFKLQFKKLIARSWWPTILLLFSVIFLLCMWSICHFFFQSNFAPKFEIWNYHELP